jgi:hypothetical protein
MVPPFITGCNIMIDMTKNTKTFNPNATVLGWITHQTEWFPFSELKAKTPPDHIEYDPKWGEFAVYQIAKNPHKDLVSPENDYTGKSGGIWGRLYGVLSGRHNSSECLKKEYGDNLREAGLSVRILFCKTKKEMTDLEKEIHRLAKVNYGKRYKHNGVSGGKAGNKYKVIGIFAKIDKLEELEEIGKAFEKRVKDVLWIQNMNSQNVEKQKDELYQKYKLNKVA